jgi:DNA-binding CsgD family transcriptional regulator
MELTERELECLDGIANGLQGDGLGFALGIHAKTVEKHLASLRKKLKAKTTAHAVAIAVEKGLVKLPQAKKTAD